MAGMSGGKPQGKDIENLPFFQSPGVRIRKTQTQKPENTIAGMQDAPLFKGSAQRPTAGGNPVVGSSGQKLGA